MLYPVGWERRDALVLPDVPHAHLRHLPHQDRHQGEVRHRGVSGKYIREKYGIEGSPVNISGRSME